MKDNTLRENIEEILYPVLAKIYMNGYTDHIAGITSHAKGVNKNWQDQATNQLETLLAEEVRKVKIEELELILNGYGWGEGEEAANFIIKDRIAELEKGK